jgi:hypothetical protein
LRKLIHAFARPACPSPDIFSGAQIQKVGALGALGDQELGQGVALLPNPTVYIAVEFNRYNREPQIRIEGEALQARQFNGVFDADDPESLVRFLESSDGIAVDRSGGEIVIHAR